MLSLEDSLGVIRGKPGSEGRGSEIGQRDSGTGQARSHPSSSSSGSQPHYHHHRSADAPAINLLQSTPQPPTPAPYRAPQLPDQLASLSSSSWAPMVLPGETEPWDSPHFPLGPPSIILLGCPLWTLGPPHPPTSSFPSQSLGLLRNTIHLERAGDRLMETYAEVHTGPSAVPTGALGTSPGHPDSTGRSIMHETVCV